MTTHEHRIDPTDDLGYALPPIMCDCTDDQHYGMLEPVRPICDRCGEEITGVIATTADGDVVHFISCLKAGEPSEEAMMRPESLLNPGGPKRPSIYHQNRCPFCKLANQLEEQYNNLSDYRAKLDADLLKDMPESDRKTLNDIIHHNNLKLDALWPLMETVKREMPKHVTDVRDDL